MPAPGHVLFRTFEPALAVDVPMGDGSATITGGYATWNKTARPRRTSLTEYGGREPFSQSVPVLFDGFAAGRSVEGPISRLERMALPGAHRADPPELVISGPILHPELAWVIDSIEWGEALRDDRAGFRIRQAATVNLLEHGVADQRARLGTVRRPHPGSHHRPRLYTVRRGDTLSSIAARELGKASRWREIAQLNGIRDPRSIKPGRQLVLP